jgi:flagellar biogenesis protein FliO
MEYPGASAAQFDPGATPRPTADEEDPGWLGALDVVAKLVLVVGLVYLAVAGLRWLQNGRRRRTDTGGASIRLLETVGLAPGRSLHLVVAGDKTLLIGATDHHLSLLTELSGASAPLGEDATAFEEALSYQSTPPQDSTAATAVEWRVAIERLRGGVQGVRQAFRGGGSEPTQ